MSSGLPPSTLATVMGLLLLICALGTMLALLRARRCQRAVSIDQLTGLLNRSGLAARLAEWPAEQAAALILVDVDHFSELNEAFGPTVGDQVLVALGQRVRVLGADGYAARWGSDEFAIVVPGVSGREALARLAESVGRFLQEPLTVGAVEIALMGHVAAGSWPFQAPTWDELQGKVDLALRRAKSSWKRTVVYDPKPDAASVQQLALVGDLRQAIDGDELRLRYQPRIRLADGAVVGAEALVRWQHPKRGLLGPGAFIPAAEAAGLVGALTRRILAIAVEDAASWQAEGWNLSVSVNLSPQDLGDVGLATYVEELLDTHGLPPELLTLEVTESAFMADASFGAELLHDLARRGVTIAIDDFGTGYSSLARVATMPARELKIDQGFVADIASAGSAAVIKATIDLAHNLDMVVVAEGVETAEQYTALLEFGCDDAQGFWLGKPMALAQLLTEVARWDNDVNSVRAKAEDPPSSLVSASRDEPAVRGLDLPAPKLTPIGVVLAAVRRAVDRAGPIPVAAITAVVAAGLAWIYVFRGQSAWATAPLAALAAGAFGLSAARGSGQAARGMRLLAMAAAVCCLGAVFPAVHVVAYGLAMAGVLSFPVRQQRTRRERAQLLLDGGALGVAAASTIWLAAIGPLLQDGGTLSEQVAGIVPPVTGLALFIALAFTVLRGVGPAYQAPMRWIVAGLAGLILSDALGPSADGAAVVALAALSLGAVMTTRPIADVHAESVSPIIVWLPHSGTVALSALLLGSVAFGNTPWYPIGGVAIAAVLLTLVVTARHVFGLREQLRLATELSTLEHTDTLTGLANRKGFIEAGEQLFERCRRDGSSMAALIADVDHFKLANDRLGHAVGDLILQQVAALCRANVLDRDLVGRYGGDEIVVLLSGADVDVAEATAHRLNSLAAEFTPEGLDYTLTVSIGVADSSTAGSLGELIRNADRALHDAKEAGPNQTAVFREPLFA